MSARFCILPAKIVGDRHLTRTDIDVLHALGLFADRNGWCWPSHQELANRIGMGRHTIIRAMAKLQKRGYIAVAPRVDSAGRKISNKYRIIFDTEEEETAETLDVADLQQACCTLGSNRHVAPMDATAIKNTPIEHPKERARARVTLDELSIDHIRDWLAEKRAEGKYHEHDEKFILEYFVNYCQSKGKTYVDYASALRNAFEWDACSPKVGRARSEIKGNVITL